MNRATTKQPKSPMGQRIQERIIELETTAAQVSKEAGLNPTYVRDLIASENPNPRYRHLKALAETLGVSVAWLDTGETADVIDNFGELRLSKAARAELGRYAKFLAEQKSSSE